MSKYDIPNPPKRQNCSPTVLTYIDPECISFTLAGQSCFVRFGVGQDTHPFPVQSLREFGLEAVIGNKGRFLELVMTHLSWAKKVLISNELQDAFYERTANFWLAAFSEACDVYALFPEKPGQFLRGIGTGNSRFIDIIPAIELGHQPQQDAGNLSCKRICQNLTFTLQEYAAIVGWAKSEKIDLLAVWVVPVGKPYVPHWIQSKYQIRVPLPASERPRGEVPATPVENPQPAPTPVRIDLLCPDVDKPTERELRLFSALKVIASLPESATVENFEAKQLLDHGIRLAQETLSDQFPNGCGEKI